MTYKCIFDDKQECSVKEEYKLTPESLNEFCKICSRSSSKQLEVKILESVLSMAGQIASQFLLGSRDSAREKEELQYKLGRAEALVTMYERQLKIEDSHKTS